MKEKYDDELEFEHDLVSLLTIQKGWREGVLKNPTEKELIQNWANILYKNNRSTDRLGNYPLTDTEMEQIITQINQKRNPLNLNGFINGKVITITRDNPSDTAHLGKSVTLKIYDRDEIAGGQSTYQIAEQPIFSKKSKYFPDRRGDLMLLINGMPVIHIELKKSGVPVAQAQNQIQKYSEEGIFTGIFSLIQVFVAMTPEETTYFANPGPDGKFNKRFYFHWESFANEIINNWQMIADQFLSIPMAHQLIGFYTIADENDGILKVMRSYQYYAANAISDMVTKIAKADWNTKKDMRGGYIWHTTGSGKTLTSFKSAQLIANSGDADKVVFLMDRVELGTQSLQEYKGFADDYDDVQATENTDILRAKMKSDNPNEVMIVTSIQKMSRLNADDPKSKNDIEKIRKKRLVIIIDECHRSVFGEMLERIQDTFPNGLMFGFTGTPIQEENEKKDNTTSSIFGKELHRYSISDGIRDGNVLGFDTNKVETFKDQDIRQAVALEKAKAKTINEAVIDEKKRGVFYHYMNEVPMASLNSKDESIEKHIPTSQYQDDKHRRMVCKNILDNWVVVSRNYKYHAILATSSIGEACEYYRLLKKMMADVSCGYPQLRITGLFDPHTDNNGHDIFKEKAIAEMLEDYDKMYGLSYTISSYGSFKKDVSNRLAHKKPYRLINHELGTTLDLLIVVNQMLTGFDSAWVNTLHLDKVLEYEGIVQAFSRTNRLKDNDKPYGIIYYYRYPNTMDLNVKEAFRLYSGDKPYGIFVDKLESNLNKINAIFKTIKDVFESNEIDDFSRNPTNNKADIEKFVLSFNQLCATIEAAKVQGFRWMKHSYDFEHDDGSKSKVELTLDENTFNIIKQRYKELFGGGGTGSTGIPPYDLDPTLVSISAEKINYDYMESNFKKYIKEIQMYGKDGKAALNILNVLRQSFASLSQDDQKLANIIINDIQRGDLEITDKDSLTDLINKYRNNKRDKAIHNFCLKWFIPEAKFRIFADQYTTLGKINEYGKLDKIVDCADRAKIAERLSAERKKKIPGFIASRELQSAIRNFMVSGCIEE